MEKFIELIKSEQFGKAVEELESKANSFGFARKVPEACNQLTIECDRQMEDFSRAFVIAVSKRYPDGRCEKSVELSKAIVAAGLVQDDRKIQEDVEARIVGGNMHPTVMQQAVQLAFYFLYISDWIPASIESDKSWWRMPLI